MLLRQRLLLGYEAVGPILFLTLWYSGIGVMLGLAVLNWRANLVGALQVFGIAAAFTLFGAFITGLFVNAFRDVPNCPGNDHPFTCIRRIIGNGLCWSLPAILLGLLAPHRVLLHYVWPILFGAVFVWFISMWALRVIVELTTKR
jgi:hypothetical protein